MSVTWRIVGAVVLGVLAPVEASAQTLLEAVPDADAWDTCQRTLATDSAAERNSTTSLVGDFSADFAADDADALLACAACDVEACAACDAGVHGCAADPCCGTDCGVGVGACGPRWYATVGTILLDREDPTAGTIVAANPGGARFFGAEALEFDVEGGYEVGLARRFDNGCILEGRYFAVDSTAAATIVTPGAFIGAGFTGPGGTLIAGRYLTTLDNTEINLRRQYGERLTLLGGFRMLELRDEARFTLNNTVARGNYDYDNRLYGGQLGGNLDLSPRAARWLANVEAKAGVYNNLSRGGISQFQGANFIGGFDGEEANTAFVGEINLNAGYRLTQHVVLRGGYQLLWIENVALASDAAVRSLQNPSLLNSVSADQGLFYHGATAGIDFVW